MFETKKQEELLLRQKLFNLEKDRESAKARVNDLKLRLKAKTDELGNLNILESELMKKVVDTRKKFESTKQEKEETTDKNGRLTKDFNTISSFIAESEKNIEDAQHKSFDSTKLIHHLEEELVTLDKHRNDVISRQNEMLQEFQNFRNLYDLKKHEINTQQDKLNLLKRQNEFARRQIDSCTREENQKSKLILSEEAKKIQSILQKLCLRISVIILTAK